jgi:GT2 family glycosyltransferase
MCVYTEVRWPDINSGVHALVNQTYPPHEIILVVDHNPDLLIRVCDAFPSLTAISNTGERGLSGARNTGVQVATGDVVAFIDDDAKPAEDWIAALAVAFADAKVACVGGLVVPAWPDGQRPVWLPPEFDWVVGCSYLGQAIEEVEIRNPIGANMAFRRHLFEVVGLFDSRMGRLGSRPLGCEETEICIRLSQKLPDAHIRFVPKALVWHRVTSQRTTLLYFASRCYSEGLSKALLSRLLGAKDGLRSERAYVLRTLTSGLRRECRSAINGHTGALQRIAVSVMGLFLTAAGYVWGSVLLSINRPTPQ